MITLRWLGEGSLCHFNSSLLRSSGLDWILPKQFILSLLVAGALCGAGNAMAAGDAAAGVAKAQTCLGCHGVEHYVNVYPSYHVPKIAGQHEAYLIAALKAYRGKLRAHPTMQANAGLLTDQDIEDIAAYFANAGGDK